jgi:hypothetical protein
VQRVCSSVTALGLEYATRGGLMQLRTLVQCAHYEQPQNVQQACSTLAIDRCTRTALTALALALHTTLSMVYTGGAAH